MTTLACRGPVIDDSDGLPPEFLRVMSAGGRPFYRWSDRLVVRDEDHVGDIRMLDQATSLAQLLAARLELLDAEKWKDFDDLQCDEALEKLHDVQEAILKLTFTDPAAKLSALKTLLDSDDQSNFTDHFKNRLFELLRSS